MDQQLPLEPYLKSLTTADSSEQMVDSLVKAIPLVVAKQGVPNMPQLQSRFQRVANTARRVALVPEDGGLWWHAFAAALSKLMVAPKGLVHGNSAEHVLARAEYHLERGNLAQAVSELETLDDAPKQIARDWTVAAKNRLLVDQVASLLEAHALTMISSLSQPRP